MRKQTIDISTGFIFRTIMILLALLFVYLVFDIIALLFISVIIVAAMDPVVDYFQKRKIPRPVSVLVLYILLIAFLGSIAFFLIPPLFNQAQDLAKDLPARFQNAEHVFSNFMNFLRSSNINLNTQQIADNFSNYLTNSTQKIFSTTVNVFTGLISIIVVFSLAFYMSVEEKGIKKFIVSITPKGHKNYAAAFTDRVESKIGRWMLGQFMLMIIIFALDSLGLYLVGVPYALILGLLAGFLEIIPYMGPVIGAIPGVIIGFIISPTTGFLALLVYVVVQQLENHIIVPQVMKKTLGLNPVAIILALLIGARLGGVLGAILAVPVAAVVGLFIGDLMDWKEERENDESNQVI